LKVSDDFAAAPPSHARTASHASPGSDSEAGQGAGVADPAEGVPDEAEGDAATRSSGGLIEDLFRFVEEIIGSAEGLIEVYADRMRLSVRRTIIQASIGAGAAVCAIIWLGAAVLAILRGVCGGFTTLWGGREWLGDLTGGLLACTLAAIAIAFFLRLSSRRELGRLKGKYERIRNGHSKQDDGASRTDNG